MRLFSLLLLTIALLSNPAKAQQIEFHNDLQGVYWNPTITGWGFAMDFQKGILFGAIYGYNNDGTPVFYTIISAAPEPEGATTFTGDVFQTTDNGTTTTDVGDFEITFGSLAGQPGAALTMTTPSRDFDEVSIERFIYGEPERLAVMSNTQAFTYFGNPMTGADEDGKAWTFTSDFVSAQGIRTLDAFDALGNPGFAYFDATSNQFLVIFPAANNGAEYFEYNLTNNRGGRGIRGLIDSSGEFVGDPLNMASMFVANDPLQAKTIRKPAGAITLSGGERADLIDLVNTHRASRR